MNNVVMQFIERLNAFQEGDPRASEKSTEKDNVKFLQEQYRALVRGDVATFAAALTDDVELDIFGGPDLPFAGRWKGRDEVLKAVVRNFSLLEDQQPEVESVVAQGDTVVVFARERGRFKSTGREYDVRWAQWFTFRDGLLFRMRELAEEGPLLAAAR